MARLLVFSSLTRRFFFSPPTAYRCRQESRFHILHPERRTLLLLSRQSTILQQPTRDNHPLNFARAFVNFRNSRITIRALNRIFPAVAVAAMNLDSLVRHASSHFAGKKFRRRRLHRHARPGVEFPRGSAR